MGQAGTLKQFGQGHGYGYGLRVMRRISRKLEFVIG